MLVVGGSFDAVGSSVIPIVGASNRVIRDDDRTASSTRSWIVFGLSVAAQVEDGRAIGVDTSSSSISLSTTGGSEGHGGCVSIATVLTIRDVVCHGPHRDQKAQSHQQRYSKFPHTMILLSSVDLPGRVRSRRRNP